MNSHWEDWYWGWSSNTLATWCKEPRHWKRRWCWKSLKAGEGNYFEQDGWVASLTQWTWISACSGRCWRTGKPCTLQSMGSQKSNMIQQLKKSLANKRDCHLIQSNPPVGGRGGETNLPNPTRAQAQVTPNRNLHKTLDQPNSPREEIKRRKEFNLKAWEKEISNTVNLKKKGKRKVLHKWRKKLEIYKTN